MTTIETMAAIRRRIEAADKRYGPFASTHEALGVCLEEWDELKQAIYHNSLNTVQHEALDLAAALIRLHDNLTDNEAMRRRSVK